MKDDEYWAYDEFRDSLSDEEWLSYKRKMNGDKKTSV